MYIRWFGESFVEIQAKSPQNGDYTVLIDPFPVKNIGLRQPKMDAQMVLMTEGILDRKLNVQGDFFEIHSPGEYEKMQVFVYGVAEEEDSGMPTGKIMYVVQAEDMRIVHLGKIIQTTFTNQQLEYLEDADVLFVPVGGQGSLNAKQAAQVVQQIEPRVIIPINYNCSRIQVKADTVDAFVKELGKKQPEIMDRLRIVKKDLPQEESDLLLVQP